MRVYANGWYRGPRKPAFFAQAAVELVARGYTAFKFDSFGGAYQQISKESEERAVAIMTRR